LISFFSFFLRPSIPLMQLSLPHRLAVRWFSVCDLGAAWPQYASAFPQNFPSFLLCFGIIFS
jgi:hypothetical protein